MILKFKAELRGSSIRIDDKGNEFHYINVEDSNGESAKFSCNNEIDLKQFKKGDNVNVELDYNIKYGSLKVVSVTKA